MHQIKIGFHRRRKLHQHRDGRVDWGHATFVKYERRVPRKVTELLEPAFGQKSSFVKALELRRIVKSVRRKGHGFSGKEYLESYCGKSMKRIMEHKFSAMQRDRSANEHGSI